MNETAARSPGISVATAIPRCVGMFAVTLAAYASVVSTAEAQTGDSVIQGRVIAADSKASLPEAIITVRSPALQGEQTVITDKSGFYRVPNLPSGIYSVRIDKENHSSFEQPRVELRSSTTVRVDGVLVPETVKGEELYLVSEAPTVDVGSSSVSTTISGDMARRVPLSRPGTKGGGVRSFESVAQAAPEAKADLYGTSVAGATSPENRYIIDGLSVNNTAYGIGSTPLTAEFIKEVNVVTGGYLPEFGRSTGGVLNVVTKTGANDWASGAWWNLTPLEGTRERLFREGSTIFWQQPELAYETDVGAEVGGPILRDKLWFYVGVDLARTMYGVERSLYQTDLDAAGMAIKDPMTGASQRQLIPGTTNNYDASSQAMQAIAKLTFTPVRHQSFTLTSIVAPLRSGGDGAFGVDPENGRPDPSVTANGRYESLAYRYEKNMFDNILKWTATSAGSRVIVDTTFGWHHETSDDLPWDGSRPGDATGQASISGVVFRRNNPGLHSIRDFEPGLIPAGYCMEPNPMSAVACPVSSYSDVSPGFIRTSTLDRYQLKSMVTVVAEALGHHVIKAGVEAELTAYQIGKAYAGGLLYREATNGASFADYRNFGYLTAPDSPVYLDVQRTDTRAFTIGGFLQNSWSVMDKVTVNAGLRYDAQYLYNTFDKLGLALPNQWSPRFGFIYDPTQKGKSRVFGSYARYYQNVPLDMADRALSGEPQIVASRTTAACDPRDPVQAKTTCRDAANLRTIGGAYDPNQKFGTLSGGTVPVDPDIKPPSVDEMVVGAEYDIIQSRVGLTFTRRRLNDIIEDMSRDEATTYFLGNPGKGIAKDFPKPVRDYDAFTAHFSRSFQANWLAQASYTLSWLRGNYSGLFRPESGQLDPNITSDFDLQSLLPNRDGPLPGDRRHQLKLFAARDWRFGEGHNVQTGIGARSSSGGPTNYLGSHPIYGPDEVFVLKRGSGRRLPWTHSIDLQAGYGFHFSKDFNLSATVAVYNVFNFQKTTQIEQRYTNSDVLPVRDASDPARLTQVMTPEGVPFDPATEVHPNFGKAVRTQEPLLLQLGVRATF